MITCIGMKSFNALICINNHVMSMLLIFHGKPSKDSYRHVDELSQVCEINHIQTVPADIMKMKLFPTTLRYRAKDWFLKLRKEFTRMDLYGGKNFAKILFRRRNQLCPKSHPQVYSWHE